MVEEYRMPRPNKTEAEYLADLAQTLDSINERLDKQERATKGRNRIWEDRAYQIVMAVVIAALAWVLTVEVRFADWGAAFRQSLEFHDRRIETLERRH